VSNPIRKNDDESEERSLGSLFRRATGGSGSGSNNFTNLSIYAFGLSGVWTGVGAGILPFKVLEVLDAGSVEIVGYALDKNGALGILSLVGLAIAAVAQLAAGALSDRDTRLGRRLPFIIFGGFGLAVITILFGFATSFIMLAAAIIAMQMFGNFGQGPANALIIDHVPVQKRGQAAGVLNLWRLLGAGSLTVIVLQFMSRYDVEDSPEWLWYSIGLMVIVLIISTLWTVLAIKPSAGLFFPAIRRSSQWYKKPVADKPQVARTPISRSYLAFLVALAFAIAAMSSMQIYALFFLQDVVGLENPAKGADLLVVVIVVSAGLTVLPAGFLSDRFGRAKLFALAGASGVTSSLLLMFVDSIGQVMAVGVIVGIAVGLFMVLTWAVANDLVRRTSAARDLGYTSIATLAGSAVARFAGIGIDELNDVSENLGYRVILVSVAISFTVAAVIFTKLSKNPEMIEIPVEFEPIAPVSAPD
jgi:MFS family permease